ncbi:hypothetical protein AMK23_34295 [Streptomyces sp. CB02130]|uniref:hypothetical protein n=1 Tax=Streptomyces sp. CB02130 TaxID=1703934 RepID=UPI00093B8784|nr:hypothetical protein [Streptomyces sp. CB02130]OKJ19370.1 hypothetical protein AMK23_34295 [Streptomyces sp. CB02130]
MGGPRNASPTERWEYKSAIDMAKALQPLRRPLSGQPTTLTSDEKGMLAQCVAAVDTLQWAFWLAGKALENIRVGKLYRAEADSFEDFVWKHWQMKKAYANKLIRTWRIAEAVFELLSNEVAPIGAGSRKKPTALGANAEKALKALNQAQVWELVPVVDTWDIDAALLVYRTTVEVDGVNVTAKVLNGAVAALPTGDFDAEQVAAHVREYLESLGDEDDEDDDPADFAARVEKAVPYRWVKRLARRDTAAASRYLDELQAHIDKCRTELLNSGAADQQPETPKEAGAAA